MSENATTEKNQSRIRRTGRAAQSGLDVLLSEAGSGGPSRFIAPGAGVRVGAGLARHPRRVAARAAGLAGRARAGSPPAGPSSRRRRAIAGSATGRGRTTGFCAACSRATSRSARPSTD